MKLENHKKTIWIISVIVPLVVAVLIFAPGKQNGDGNSWTTFLPHLNAVINSATSIILITGFVFIKNNKPDWHKGAMISAFILGCIFLISYITYHATSPSTVFGDINGDGIVDEAELISAGVSRSVYLLILLSHIVLAAIVVPFVLFAFYYALSGKLDRHRKIVKFTFPIWLYVSVTGVIVYLMISPYY